MTQKVSEAKKKVAAAEKKVAAAKQEVAAAEKKVEAAEKKVAEAEKKAAAAETKYKEARETGVKDILKDRWKNAEKGVTNAIEGVTNAEKVVGAAVEVLMGASEALSAAYKAQEYGRAFDDDYSAIVDFVRTQKAKSETLTLSISTAKTDRVLEVKNNMGFREDVATWVNKPCFDAPTVNNSHTWLSSKEDSQENRAAYMKYLKSVGDDIPFDTDSTIEEVQDTVEESKDAFENLTGMLGDLSVDKDTTGMVEYKGKKVKSSIAIVMTHVADKMNDHWGGKDSPNMTFHIGNLSHLPYDEKYKSKGDEPGDRWYSAVTMKYKIGDTDYPFDNLAFDNAFIDLTPKLNKTGVNARNYGSTWINIYFPTKQMKRMIQVLSEHTGWKISNKGITLDHDQGLMSMAVNMETQEPPYFNAVYAETDESGDYTGRVVTSRKGTVQSMCMDPDFQQIYKGTVFLTVSMSVLTAVGTTQEPTPKDGLFARIKFGLSSVKALGIAENINPVRLGGKRVNNSLF